MVELENFLPTSQQGIAGYLSCNNMPHDDQLSAHKAAATPDGWVGISSRHVIFPLDVGSQFGTTNESALVSTISI